MSVEFGRTKLDPGWMLPQPAVFPQGIYKELVKNLQFSSSERGVDVASAELSADPLCMFVGSHVCLSVGQYLNVSLLLAFGLFVCCVNKPEFIHCFTATVLLDTAV